MVSTQRRRRPTQSPTRRLALVAVPLLVLGVTACGDMTAPEGATTAPPAVTDSSTTDPTMSPGSGDVAAVIGGWAARYGSARNDVESAMETLGAAAAKGAAGVKPAATDALAALKAAHEVPICPDPATEKAFRATLDELTAKVSPLTTSGDPAAAQQAADDAAGAWTATDDALAAVYG